MSAVLGGALLLAAWLLVDARRVAWMRAGEAAANLAQVLEQDIEHSLDTYDYSLQAVQEGLRLPQLASLPLETRRSLLFDRLPTPRYFGAPIVADATGLVTLSAVGLVPPGLSVADRDYFQAQQSSSSDELFLGHPFRSKLTGLESVGLSRRLSNTDGSFAGVVAGTMRLSFLRDLLERVHLAPGGAVSVLMTDGTLLMRMPYDPGLIGRSLSGSPAFSHIETASSGFFEERSRIDGVERLFSYHRLGLLPLVVVVAQSMDAVYAEWRERALITALAVLPLLAATMLLGWSLLREKNRRHGAERTAAELGLEFRATFDRSADGLFMLRITPPGRFVLERANAALARLWGLPQVAMEGREPRSFLQAHMIAQMEQYWLATAQSGTATRYSLVIEQGNRTVELETVVTPVRSPDGQVSLLLGSTRDTTERAEMTEQLAQARKAEQIGRMTAGVIHDFTNLLQTVTVGVRELVAQSPDSNTSRRVSLALQALSRGVALTRRLLSFSSQKQAPAAVIDPGRLIADLRDLVAWSIGPRIQVQTVVGAALWPVQVDAAQLEMALLNLSGNARDAMGGGGRLLIRARNAPAREAAQNGLTVADHVVICVQDSGPGMDEATRSRVFEAFYTTKSSDRGTGLGLWMVRSFARQAGGDVRIDSEPGKGTQVSIWLPRIVDAVPAQSEPQIAPRSFLARSAQVPGRILLVDDDDLVRQALSRLLMEAGHEVVPVSGADDALRLLAAADRLDLLIADQSIPGMSGTELVLEAFRRRPGLPAMVITGYAELAETPPHIRVLHKPIDADALLAEVSTLLSPATPEVAELT